MKQKIVLIISFFSMFFFSTYALAQSQKNAIKLQPQQKILVNKKDYVTLKLNYPLLVNPNQTLSKSFNAAVQKKIDVTIRQYNTNLEPPKALVKLAKQIKGMPLSVDSNQLNVRYKILTSANNIISIRFDNSMTYYAHAHPNTSFTTLNYDIKNNRELTLKKLFKPNKDYLQVLSDYSKQQLIKKIPQASQSSLTKEQRNNINSGTKPVSKNFRNWNITAKGLLITFPAYQVAAYYYGPQEVLIPYSVLQKILAKNFHLD